jgi:hypothetical protein
MRKWICTLFLAGWGGSVFAQGNCQAVLCPPVGLSPDECHRVECKLLECKTLECPKAECKPQACLTCVEPCDIPSKQGAISTCQGTTSSYPVITAGCCSQVCSKPASCSPQVGCMEVDCGKTSGGVLCGSACQMAGPAPKPAKSHRFLDCLRKLFVHEKKSKHSAPTNGTCDTCNIPSERIIYLDSPSGNASPSPLPSKMPSEPLAAPSSAPPVLPTPNLVPAKPLPPQNPRTMPPASDPQSRMQFIPGNYPLIQPVPAVPVSRPGTN